MIKNDHLTRRQRTFETKMASTRTNYLAAASRILCKRTKPAHEIRASSALKLPRSN